MPNKTIEEILEEIGDLPIAYKKGDTEIIDFDYLAEKVEEIKKGLSRAFEAGYKEGLNRAIEIIKESGEIKTVLLPTNKQN